MRHMIDKRHDHIDPRPQDRTQTAKAFNHMLFGLRDDLDRFQDQDHDQQSQQKPSEVIFQKADQHVFEGQGRNPLNDIIFTQSSLFYLYCMFLATGLSRQSQPERARV